MRAFWRSFKEITRYPTAVVGMVMIVLLVILSIVVVIAIPYEEAIYIWRGSEDTTYHNPKNAPPAWTNLFNELKKPESMWILSSDLDDERVSFTPGTSNQGFPDDTYVFTFDYNYDYFPQELSVYFNNEFEEKGPFMSLMWYKPDGSEVRIGDFGVAEKQTYRFNQDEKLQKRLKGVEPIIGMFMDPESDPENPTVLKGTYQLEIKSLAFEADTQVSAELVMHGLVHGIAGTDNMRRDISLALLWGTPIALVFGLVAAVGTSVLTMVIAGIGVWYGGVVDALIQRITEINMVLPFLSILVMIGTFYSKDIWVILGATIALSIFTGGIKNYRAIFMQVKQSTYIEAAQTYGAGDWRIIILYLIPRVVPMLIPGLVLSVPAFVFLEASLAVLGLGDPVLPTWGKLINSAGVAALYNGFYYWLLEPMVLLMVTGFAFAMLGFSLDRIFNPRLRGQ
ncbi:MAG: ABC transporter permease [Anaerolineae bacterium]|jgi:peptide/nickel transport system permease protein|nr:ABC transporter permease [Anaerolineae bacterium]